MHLHKLQEYFWNNLREVESPLKCDEKFSSNGKLTAAERLNIYKQTSLTAHINAISKTYPHCERILGKKYFAQLASKYFYKHSATDQNLNTYGNRFPEYLQECVRDQHELHEYPYLPDLASIENAYEKAYFSKDNELFDFDGLANLDENSQQKIYFKLSESLYTIRSNYPIYEIWLANQNDEHQDEVQAIHEPQHLCVYRLSLIHI